MRFLRGHDSWGLGGSEGRCAGKRLFMFAVSQTAKVSHPLFAICSSHHRIAHQRIEPNQSAFDSSFRVISTQDCPPEYVVFVAGHEATAKSGIYRDPKTSYVLELSLVHLVFASLVVFHRL
jgi:hypothetical protein